MENWKVQKRAKKNSVLHILAIETSCDETAISVLEGDTKMGAVRVLANELISQIAEHRPYGGVFPMLAKREHIKNLPVVFEQAIEKSGVSMEKGKIDAIAVTHGPGLEPALWTGINFAQDLGKKWNIPVVPINHMEGHIFISLFRKNKIQEIHFPALALLISGGHTELVLMRDWFEYEIVGETRDDAVGECFDKAARIVGLSYPGGPEISNLAEKFRSLPSLSLEGEVGRGLLKNDSHYVLPRPMLHSGDLDFSFSGLKTAVLYMVQKIPNMTDKIRQEICFEFEEAVTEVLLKKTLAAREKYGAKSILVGGGVSANAHIRRVFHHAFQDPKENSRQNIFFPENNLSGDNALMIALACFFRLAKGEISEEKKENPETLKAHGNLRLDEC